ncbi:hypothetical protein CUMW_234440 [Citrus unshiu]|uniref:RING-type E3 ubiquitin transferase n=1 Tax=Citrus unshiu TaxID=55188 RepID=A0A2H5QK02_CITUN|nr:hypothetical protein CUMW_234440 [Citrus unshiu]
MAGNYRFAMDQKDIVRLMITSVGSFIQDRLINQEERTQHKEQCAERLAAEDGSNDKDSEFRYSDQAVLANLDWGIEALEEAINTSNMETKLARLDYAEKMLQVCAMLDSDQQTAGVPNFYLSAWAHLNLSYLWKLRNNVHNSVLHVLEMFSIDPFFSRIDFAPELWKELFLPQMSSIVGWYSEARHRLVMEAIPDSSDLSFTADLDQFFNESLIFSMRPEQVEKLQQLEQLYGDSLDENTRMFAKYYKDCVNSDSSTRTKVIPMLPIAEPPATPLHEFSRSIPDYVKFGPVLPKSAGFSAVLKSKSNMRGPNRMNVTSMPSQDLDESFVWDPQGDMLEENEYESDYEPVDDYINSGNPNSASPSGAKMIKDEESELKEHVNPIFSPIDSPKTRSPKISSPKPDVQNLSPKTDVHGRKEPKSLLRLLSSRISHSPVPTSSPSSPQLSKDYSISSADSDGELVEKQKSSTRNSSRARSMSYEDVNIVLLENSPCNESDEGSQSCNSLPCSEKMTSRSRPPKDFVCPITGQIFNDPVTLETGQTYERKAIQEWLKRGNTTCPITRQPLCSNSLPKTNYVLKRLITSWKEQYPDLAQEFSYSETPKHSFGSSPLKDMTLASSPSRTFNFHIHNNTDDHINQRRKRFTQAANATSPTSVISQASVETIINGLKPYVTCLCTSENLQECETAVLAIARLWKESTGDPGVHAYLLKPTIINGFAEILSASLSREVLRTSVYILSELMVADESVGDILTSVDSDFDCLAALLKNGLGEAAVLIYQLRPAFAQLSAHEFIPSLVQLVLNKTEEFDELQFVMEPKDAAIEMLDQILMGGDKKSRSITALSLISANGIPALIKCLDRVEERRSIVSILLCCMHADKSCKTLIAKRIELSHVLDLFHDGNDSVRGICINFLSELVLLNRRTFSNQILQVIRDEGAFSTMHTFLVYLQMAPMEQQPATASLLLQLDLLVEPRKMSMYREEAVEALIEALRRKDFPNSQMMALDALLSLTGRFTFSGKSYTEALLLKISGFDQPYNALMKPERLSKPESEMVESMEEEEQAACSWEKRVAFVLCNHEKGSIFKALEECLKSNSLEMAKSCLVIAAWLTHMLSTLPDTGVRGTARRSLLDEFINVLQSSKNLEEKILTTLALKTFISDPVALEELGKYAKCIYGTLRKLKKYSAVVTDIQKALMNLSSVNATELWHCNEVTELDSSTNGEVLSLIHLKGRVLSSHSDGTIKMWDSGKRVLRLIQEVREHTKAVTCLYVPSSGDKLYSGSLDKAIRVYNWSGAIKHINFNKHVKSLVMTGDKLYCGCSGYSIQEVDFGQFNNQSTFYARDKTFSGTNINTLHMHNGLLFAGGSSVDGTAGKVLSISKQKHVDHSQQASIFST